MSQRAKPNNDKFFLFLCNLIQKEKTHLNVCIIFAAASNLSLSVLLLLNLTVEIQKNPGPVSNYAEVLKYVKQIEDQLKFLNLNYRTQSRKRGDMKPF